MNACVRALRLRILTPGYKHEFHHLRAFGTPAFADRTTSTIRAVLLITTRGAGCLFQFPRRPSDDCAQTSPRSLQEPTTSILKPKTLPCAFSRAVSMLPGTGEFEALPSCVILSCLNFAQMPDLFRTSPLAPSKPSQVTSLRH